MKSNRLVLRNIEDQEGGKREQLVSILRLTASSFSRASTSFRLALTSHLVATRFLCEPFLLDAITARE